MKKIRYDDYKLDDNVLTWVGQTLPLSNFMLAANGCVYET